MHLGYNGGLTSGPYSFGGSLLRGVRLFAQTVDVSCRPDAAEADRRRALGVGAMTDPDLLRALMGIPEGLPVAIEALAAVTTFALDELLSCGAVEIIGGHVIRRAVPPVELLGLTKVVSDWSEVQAITLLRTHAPRMVIAPATLARRILAEVDAEVGVSVQSARGEVGCRRLPGASRVRPSWQRWFTAEVAYGAWLSREGQPSTSSQALMAPGLAGPEMPRLWSSS